MALIFERGWSGSQCRAAMQFWKDVRAFGSCELSDAEVEQAVTFMFPEAEWLLGYDDDVLYGVVGYRPEAKPARWPQEVTLGAIHPAYASNDAAFDALVRANVEVGRSWPSGESMWGTETPSDQPFAAAIRRAYGAAIRELPSQTEGWSIFEGRVIDGQIADW